MKKKLLLFLQMLIKGLLGFLLMGLLLFGCAGSLAYWNAWLFLAVLAALMLTTGLALLAKEPDALRGRMKTKETQTAQKGYVGISGAAFLLCFALAGLCHRFGWAQLPLWAVLAALAVMAGGYGMYAAVIFQNAYASRVVEVQKGQSVISTGLYAVVRHPMYLASLLVFLPMPLVLGSWLALAPMLAFPFALVLRIQNEEKMLLQELPGYAEYVKKTKYRLIPFIW